MLFIDLFSSSLVDFYVCLFTQSMRIFSTGRDPIGPRFSLSKNSSSKLFLIRTIILREELGRFEPILHCPDWGRYSAIHNSYSHSTMRHGQLTISNLNGEMMRKVLLTYTKATRNYHCPRDGINNFMKSVNFTFNKTCK